MWTAFICHDSAVLTANYGPDGDAAVVADSDLSLWVEEMRSPEMAAVTSFSASFGSVMALTEAVSPSYLYALRSTLPSTIRRRSLSPTVRMGQTRCGRPCSPPSPLG